MSEISNSSKKNFKRLAIVFCLTSTFMIAEAIGGYLTNSLALLADAAHMLTDAGSIGLALIAIWFAGRSATKRKTYGYYRAEILAAFVNSLALLVISIYILYEAWKRLQNPPEVLSMPMLIIAFIGLIVNLIGMKLLHGSASKSLNIKGAYLEVLSDTLGSLGVIIAGIIMLTTGWYLADPIISAIIGLFIIPRTWKLLSEVIHILMEGTPAHIDLDSIAKEIKKIEGIKSVHDLHVWTITSGFDAMSAHVVVNDISDGIILLSELQQVLREKFKIEHTTIQIEPEDHKEEAIC